MTENTTPAATGTPTFGQWFRSSYGLRMYPITLIMISSTLYVTASIAVAAAGLPLPVSTIVTAALGVLVIAAAVAKLRRGYRAETAPTPVA